MSAGNFDLLPGIIGFVSLRYTFLKKKDFRKFSHWKSWILGEAWNKKPDLQLHAFSFIYPWNKHTSLTHIEVLFLIFSTVFLNEHNLKYWKKFSDKIRYRNTVTLWGNFSSPKESKILSRGGREGKSGSDLISETHQCRCGEPS